MQQNGSMKYDNDICLQALQRYIIGMLVSWCPARSEARWKLLAALWSCGEIDGYRSTLQ